MQYKKKNIFVIKATRSYINKKKIKKRIKKLKTMSLKKKFIYIKMSEFELNEDRNEFEVVQEFVFNGGNNNKKSS